MTIITHIIQLILLKRKTKDISYSPSTAFIFFIASVYFGYIEFVATPGLSQPLIYSLVFHSIHLASLYLILRLNKKEVRFTQTVTALMGVSLILGLLVLLSIKLFHPVIIIAMTFMLWNTYINITILRDTLESSFLQALLFSILIPAIALVGLITLFPEFLNESEALSSLNKPTVKS